MLDSRGISSSSDHISYRRRIEALANIKDEGAANISASYQGGGVL